MIRNIKIITASSFVAMFFLGVGGALIGSAARDIGLTAVQIGVLIAVQNAGFLLSVGVAGALADTHPKPRLLLIGSLCLAIAFLTFYLSPSYWINLAVMFLFGIGMGAYEGVTDAMLLDLHEARAGLFVNVNHFFVTFGSLLIALYLIFPQMSWQVAVVQCGIGVLLLAGVFALTSLQNKPRPVSRYRDKLGILTKDVVIGLLFLTTALIVGAEAGSIGIISTYLAEVRGFPPTLAQLGLVVFLVAVAAGRLMVGFAVRPKQILGFTLALFGLAAPSSAVFYFVDLGSYLYTYLAAFLAGLTLSALLPLVLTFAGLLYEEMAGTALGAVKIAIPLGGIVPLLIMSLIASKVSLQASLIVFPISFLLGFLSVLAIASTVAKRRETG
ncbi:MAG: MFS transporter [Anaerolineae bacterium]|nr:MFS transporter [Anaerolineae bacterium]